jgi:hypothetical protein
MTCPECGFVYPVKSRSIRTVDGSLVEITDDDATMLRLKRKQEEGRAHSLPELMAIEKARGYKKGWAWFRWKSRMAHKRSTTPDPAEKTLL